MKRETAERHLHTELQNARNAVERFLQEGRSASVTNAYHKAVRRARTALHVAYMRGSLSSDECRALWLKWDDVPSPDGEIPTLEGLKKDGVTHVEFTERDETVADTAEETGDDE